MSGVGGVGIAEVSGWVNGDCMTKWSRIPSYCYNVPNNLYFC